MSNYQNSEQNPSGIWQTLWASSLQEFNKTRLENNPKKFDLCWQILENLYSDIPPDSQNDVKDKYNAAKKFMEREITGYNNVEIAQNTKIAIYKQKQLLIELKTAIIHSLYDRKWITKNSGFGGIDPNKESEEI